VNDPESPETPGGEGVPPGEGIAVPVAPQSYTAFKARMEGAGANASDTIGELERRAEDEKKPEYLTSRSYLLAKDVEYLLGVVQGLASANAEWREIVIAAHAVTARPDTDNLAKLAATVRKGKKLMQASVAMAKPGAPA
jgi:hypothetical protein